MRRQDPNLVRGKGNTVRIARWIPIWGLLLLLAAIAGPATAEDPAVDPEAAAVLARMSEVLASAKHFYFTTELTDDFDLDEGRFIQASWTTSFVVRRPDRLRVTYSEIEAMKRFYYDGKSWNIHFLEQDLFCRMEVPGSIDKALDKILDEYGIVLPVADLIYSDAAEVLTATVQRGFHAGLQSVRGVICDHVVLQEEDIDTQIWIQHDGRPLPSKFVISYHTLPGSPQVTGFLSDWDFATPAPDALFEFQPAAGAQEIQVINANDFAALEGGSR